MQIELTETGVKIQDVPVKCMVGIVPGTINFPLTRSAALELHALLSVALYPMAAKPIDPLIESKVEFTGKCGFREFF